MLNNKPNKSFKPNYHFYPITGWCNDPNGLIQWKGRYHMFYQYNPTAPVWGPMHWGHAISEDLIHWRHLPVALYPKRKNVDDISGIFSGSAIDDNGIMRLIYTNYYDPKYHPISYRETQCIAESDDGINFKQFERNPVIEKPPMDNVNGFRDPKVWRDKDGKWKVVIGSGYKKRGCIFLYSSEDFINWKFEGTFFELEDIPVSVLECPDFFYLNEKGILIFSINEPEIRGSFYCIGNVKDQKFILEKIEKMDFGIDYYAPQTFLDDKWRRIVIAWMQHHKDEILTLEEGWSGIMTLPREVLYLKNKLYFKPVDEVENLILETIYIFNNIEIAGKRVFPLDKIEKNCYEIKIDIELIKNFSQGLSLNIYNNFNENIKLSYYDKKFEVDTTKSGVGNGGLTSVEIGGRKKLSIDLFIDSSSIEVFIDKEFCGSFRIYPKYVYDRLSLTGDFIISSLKVNVLKNIWI